MSSIEFRKELLKNLREVKFQPDEINFKQRLVGREESICDHICGLKDKRDLDYIRANKALLSFRKAMNDISNKYDKEKIDLTRISINKYHRRCSEFYTASDAYSEIVKFYREFIPIEEDILTLDSDKDIETFDLMYPVESEFEEEYYDEYLSERYDLEDPDRLGYFSDENRSQIEHDREDEHRRNCD